MLKAGRIKGALAVTAALLALAGCGSGSDGKGGGSSSPTAQADPYQKAPWRMEVVNLLNALRTPQDGRYRTWMSDDPDYWTRSFAYTPRSASDPGWNDRTGEGYTLVYPAKLKKQEKAAFFNAITRDNTVVASTLTVTRADQVPQGGKADYNFFFKVKTTDGKWLTGQAVGNGTKASDGVVTRLTYDAPKS